MGLLDKLKGTRPPKEGVAPVSVDELRSTLDENSSTSITLAPRPVRTTISR